jgi:hypothetical protein
MDSLGIDRRKIDRGVFLSGFDKQSEIDIPMDKIDVLFESDSPIKWDRIVQNGGGESSEQGGKLWYNAIGRVLGTLPMPEVVMMTIQCLRKFSKHRDVLLDVGLNLVSA